MTVIQYIALCVWFFSHKVYFQSLLVTWHISSVQALSRIWLFATPWTAARQASLSITNSRSLFKLISIESVMPSGHFSILALRTPWTVCRSLESYNYGIVVLREASQSFWITTSLLLEIPFIISLLFECPYFERFWSKNIRLKHLV